MKKEFDEFREYGFVIESSSTWSTPSFVMKKKNGEYRIVTNFRYLNLQLVPVMFPLPLMSDLKMVAANETIFSKFDYVKAFYSIGVREKDWHLLCTGTSFGSFLYTVVPIGLTTSPSVMTRCMNALFITHIRSSYYAYHKERMPEGNYVFCFVDNIILATESEELHHKIIDVIFYICTQYGLTLKPGKCATGYDCIEYLSNMVSRKATWPTPHRVKALANMALPTTVTELRSFLDPMGFVRTFTPHYSQVSHDLEHLTGCLTRREAQRTPVQWTKAAVLVFLKIKHKLIHFAYNYIIDAEAPLFISADSS